MHVMVLAVLPVGWAPSRFVSCVHESALRQSINRSVCIILIDDAIIATTTLIVRILQVRGSKGMPYRDEDENVGPATFRLAP